LTYVLNDNCRLYRIDLRIQINISFTFIIIHVFLNVVLFSAFILIRWNLFIEAYTIDALQMRLIYEG